MRFMSPKSIRIPTVPRLSSFKANGLQPRRKKTFRTRLSLASSVCELKATQPKVWTGKGRTASTMLPRRWHCRTGASAIHDMLELTVALTKVRASTNLLRSTLQTTPKQTQAGGVAKQSDMLEASNPPDLHDSVKLSCPGLKSRP